MEGPDRKKGALKHLIGLCIWMMVAAAAFFSFFVVIQTAFGDLGDGEASYITARVVRRHRKSPSNLNLLANTLAFGVVSFISFGLRMINRGWVLKKYHIEDYMMSVTMLLFLALLITINFSAHFSTNLYPAEHAIDLVFNPVEISRRIVGSKLVIAVEQLMLAVTWGVKLCIWMFLLRLHRNLKNFRIALVLLLGFILVGFLTTEIAYFFGFCRPFSHYWSMPVTNPECATYHHYSIVQMVFNITTDIALIVMPMPMVWTTKLPMKRKLVLTGVFGIAIFTVMAALLNKLFRFKYPLTTIYQLWYIREASTAIIVGNMICTWQLLQKLFRLRSFDGFRVGIRDNPPVNINIALPSPHLESLHRGYGFVRRKVRETFSRTEGDIFDEGEIEESSSVAATRSAVPVQTANGTDIELDIGATGTRTIFEIIRDGDVQEALEYRARNEIS